jgi:hypothetical protein
MWPLLIFGALVAKRIVAEHDLESNYIPIRCDICGAGYWLHVAARRGDIDRCDVCESHRRQQIVRAEKRPEPRDAEFEAAIERGDRLILEQGICPDCERPLSDDPIAGCHRCNHEAG